MCSWRAGVYADAIVCTSGTRQIPGHDFKQKPLHFQLPSQEQRRKAITLYGMLPAVEEKRMDVLFEWRRNDESASWMDLLDPDGQSLS